MISINKTFPFDNNTHSVRFFTDEQDDLWILAKDLGDALGLKNIKKQVKNLEGSQRAEVTVSYPSGSKRSFVISEVAMYKLVMRCKKQTPIIKNFQNWVGEVIKSIRKTGKYEMKQDPQLEYNIREQMFRLMEEFPDDAIVRSIGKDYILNSITQKQIEHKEKQYDLSALLQGLGIGVNKDIRRMLPIIGRSICKKYREKYNKEPRKSERLVNGLMRSVSYYTEAEKDFVEKCIKELNLK